MKCESVLRYLDGFRTGELTPTDSGNLADHLSECESCAGALSVIETIAARAPKLRVPAPRPLMRQVLAGTENRYGPVETALGTVHVGFGVLGITMIHFSDHDARTFEEVYRRRFSRHLLPGTVPTRFVRAVQKAADGRPAPEVPIDLAPYPAFTRDVLLALRKIPLGEVRPYAWLAREAGRPRAIRAVARTMARNPVPLLFPCHRVVPTQGGIGRYAYGSALKRMLLSQEGVSVEQLEHLALRKLRLIGSDTTRVYCFPTCRDARRITPDHRVLFSDEHEALVTGYRPCRRCRPPASYRPEN